ncbi:MAG: Strongly similar to sigma 54 response regulator [uncultured bacterium]|nr:MAG: Strongly similar to sigma 54 response regulator [uncultured bacterium]
MNKTLLLIDDDQSFLKLSKMFLSKHSWEIDAFESWNEAAKTYYPKKYAIVLVDLNIGNDNGMNVIKEIKDKDVSQSVGIITGHSSVESAVNALRMGVDDYITKPCENEEILIRIENMFSLINKDEQIRALKDEIAGKYTFHNLITQDSKMISLCELARTIASTDATVLLQGETGTGKEVLSKAIHYNSPRKNNPFIVVNCAGINENLLESHLFGHIKGAFTGAHENVKGKFEVAENGTIFLDEISETSMNFQKKFLRVLEERTFERVGESKSIKCNARIIAASNKNIKTEVEKGSFRKDLYYRLNVMVLEIPPLRNRHGDIILLAGHFANDFAKTLNKTPIIFSEKLNNALIRHPWPGNIRELRHFIEKISILSTDGIVKDEFFPALENLEEENDSLINSTILANNFQDFLLNAEKLYFENLMKKYNCDISKIAEHAMTAKKTIYAKIHKYNLNQT